MTKSEIIRLIESDRSMMDILRKVQEIHLSDWWVGGGFIRSKVWDHLHGYTTPTPIPDIDVIYFDKDDFKENEIKSSCTKSEKKYEDSLIGMMPHIKWEVVNQARMHVFHGCLPYKNSSDALKDWVETATCIAVRLNRNGSISLSAPWGVEDLVNLILRPANKNPERVKEFYRRIESKGWLQKWPKLKIIAG